MNNQKDLTGTQMTIKEDFTIIEQNSFLETEQQDLDNEDISIQFEPQAILSLDAGKMPRNVLSGVINNTPHIKT